MGMDPITAVFNFLSTPEGQKLVAPLVELNTEFVKIIADFVVKIHSDIVAKNTPPSVPPKV